MRIVYLLPVLSFLAAVHVFADDIADSRRNAIVTSIERAAPAVVSVNVAVRAQRRVQSMFDEYWGLFDVPRPQYQIQKRRMNSVGSGFVFDARGHIITNYHVIEEVAEVVSVTLPDGREIPVDVVGADGH